jgi:hypothetical protein
MVAGIEVEHRVVGDATVKRTPRLPKSSFWILRRHDRCDLRQPFPSQNLGFGCQSTPLVIGESHATMADLLAKNAIFPYLSTS